MVETTPISAPEMSAKKEKLVLRKVVHGKPQSLHITVAFNPTSLKEEDVIRYLETEEMGAVNFAEEFRSRPTAILNFDFILDATGANQPADEKITGVLDSVKTIREITQDYDGNNHEPPWVEVSWGPNVVRGRTILHKVEYTLFEPSGEPLRANVSIAIEKPPSICRRSTKAE